MGVWDPVRYGWGVVYWLTIEGVPVVWIERETTLPLPTGFAQDASLIIDRSSEVGQRVDRDTGLGTGFPLTFHLLDTLEVRGWLKRWPLQASLTANVAWNDGTINVDSTTGWAAPGAFWLGLERITYTGLTATTFTGCTHGTAGSLASQHFVGSIGSVVSSLPRWWLGRQVRLYASPCTPSGYMTGAALTDEAEEVWRGTLDQGPDRVGALWELQALALDRRLDLPLAALTTGKIVDTQARFPVEPSHDVSINVAGFNNGVSPPAKLWEFYVTLEPFAGYASGALLTPAEQADAISAAWVAALPTTVNLVSGLFDAATYLGALVGKDLKSIWHWYVELQAAALPAAGVFARKVSFNGKNAPASETKVEYLWKATIAGEQFSLNWSSNGDHLVGQWTLESPWQLTPTGVTVELDTPAVLPSSGRLSVESAFECTYTTVVQDGMLAFFAGLYQDGIKPLSLLLLKPGATVTLLHTIGGKAQDVARKLLSSSGTAQRGAYDTLGFGAGYGFDGSSGAGSAVNVASFDQLAAGPLVALPVQVVTDDLSFAQCFGGLLALSQRGVVVRGDDLLGARRQRLALVSTEPGGSAWTKTITDDDLLTTKGDAVRPVRKRGVPNVIRVLSPLGAEEPDVVTVTDGPAVAQQGASIVEYELPFPGKLNVDQVTQWALSRFVAAQTEQAIEVDLVPWLDLDVGDLVRLQLTHFAIWQWSTGTPGYTGNGRVLGVARDLKPGRVTATILIDGTTQKLALCPSMQVVSWTGAAGAPATIKVARRFFTHLEQTLAQNGAAAVRLLHYEAGLGNENGGGAQEYDAVVDDGTNAVLTISNTLGGAVLSASSWLTLPAIADSTTYQASFAHVDDGSSWG